MLTRTAMVPSTMPLAEGQFVWLGGVRDESGRAGTRIAHPLPAQQTALQDLDDSRNVYTTLKKVAGDVVTVIDWPIVQMETGVGQLANVLKGGCDDTKLGATTDSPEVGVPAADRRFNSTFELIGKSATAWDHAGVEVQNRMARASAELVVDPAASKVSSATDRNLARLRRFQTWNDNWDGEGAPAPSAATLRAAVSLLSLLAYEQATTSVGLDADARPMFNLRDSLYEGHIVVEPGGKLSFTFLGEGGQLLDGFDIEFDERSIPVALKEALSHV